MGQTLDVSDMQGLLVSAYAHLPCAAYVMCRITDADQARRWLRTLSGHLTTAERKQEGASLNVALTASGLKALGLPASTLEGFSVAFQEGMASERRARVLGDSGPNAPQQWKWGNSTALVDVAIMHYAVDDDEIKRQLRQWQPAAGLEVVAQLQAGRQPDAREHFGFLDGVGQPVVAGSGREKRQKRRTGHATELPAGEFILGYENVYGTEPPMPAVPAANDPANILQEMPEKSRGHAFGRNGSYVVFRQLAQNVAEFWKYMEHTAHQLWPNDPTGATRLAAKCVGRWPSGAPLVGNAAGDPFGGVPQDHPDNTFAFAKQDPHGDACPLGAHIRRANPRDALGPDPKTARSAANRHRLLRRGRSYGDRVPDDRRTQDDGMERGLHFICLNADLERQFEFVQQTWVNNPVFAGLFDETDPIVGDQTACTGAFTIQAQPLRQRAHDLRAFVTLRGGGYFFMPGLRAFEYVVSDRVAGPTR